MEKVILVVDDEPLVREIVRETLQSQHIQVLEACNGNEAYELIKVRAIDCVVSDVRMPGGNGLELVKNIYQLAGAKPKIILMTGYSDLSWDQARSLNVAKMIAKPFDPDELAKEVADLMRD